MRMSEKGLCGVHKLAWILVIIGALNWGLVGLNDNWNVVHAILGGIPLLEDIVYILVGLSAVASLACGSCKSCKK